VFLLQHHVSLNMSKLDPKISIDADGMIKSEFRLLKQVEYDQQNPDDEQLDESDDWLAAELRQIFRAYDAKDSKAIKVAMFYFDHYLTITVRRGLYRKYPIWNGGWRCFDGIVAKPEFPTRAAIRLRGEVCILNGDMTFYYEPLDFEMELFPETGEFHRYVFRFGDHRPLEEKGSGKSDPSNPVGGWAYVIDRTRNVSGIATTIIS
jgi:hypothetical protein